MEYKIEIKGMHCQGCSSLLTMLLDEQGFTDIVIDMDTQSGSFYSNFDKTEVETKLNSAFEEAKDYSYSNLQEVR